MDEFNNESKLEFISEGASSAAEIAAGAATSNPLLIVSGALKGGKKLPKLIVSLVIGVLLLLISVLMVFTLIISGLFELFTTTKMQQSYHALRTNIVEVFQSVNNQINDEVKLDVYEFMPNFSINLSKANINNSFNGSFLILYDTAEVQEANERVADFSSTIRQYALENNISAFNSFAENYNVQSDLTLQAISADTAFMQGMDISEYNIDTQQLLYSTVRSSMNDYQYHVEEYTDENGEKVKVQKLTEVVMTDDGPKERIVEYIAIGETEIYIPKLMSYYNTALGKEVYRMAEEEPEKLDEDMEETFESYPATEDDEPGFFESMFNAMKGMFNENDLTNLNVFEVANMKKLLMEGNDGEGLISVDVEEYTNGNTEKLVITITAPPVDTWEKVFSIETQEDRESAAEIEELVGTLLLENGISESDLYISFDEMVQSALFTYFEGFFNLPVNESDLAPNGNGVLIDFGMVDELHIQGIHKLYSVGLSLNLADSNVPVRVNILPTATCFEDIIIAAVYDMEERDIFHPSFTYNHSAVTLAYLIDTVAFESEYGFPFPEIRGVDEVVTPDEDGYITLFVEYSCLNNLTISEYDIGASLFDVLDNGGIIGYSHSGNMDPDKDLHIPNTAYHHYFNNEFVPHCTIKTAFISGTVIYNKYDDSGANFYQGLSVGMYSDFSGGAVYVNPRLWFKGFRTDLAPILP